MVKIDPNNQTQTDASANQPNSTVTNQAPHQPAGLMTIIGQLLPLAPFAFEQFTGQKVPHMTGTIAEMKNALLLIQTNLQTIANNQQTLSQRLMALENSANNLTHQFKSLRLTHTKEQKQIEYRPNQSLENNQEDY